MTVRKTLVLGKKGVFNHLKKKLWLISYFGIRVFGITKYFKNVINIYIICVYLNIFVKYICKKIYIFCSYIYVHTYNIFIMNVFALIDNHWQTWCLRAALTLDFWARGRSRLLAVSFSRCQDGAVQASSWEWDLKIIMLTETSVWH